ncbi:hypothetical protein TNCV_2449901 [Trichonephila clavipes]|uniref:Uncharacterized protein n=1 Tax=Trichonephila clavipes TaxID=2585209 RepID=A0A8X6R8R0_TRICX|nr:hypothetical protein TNCV_2449901 [Trichonephila clavipes]
MFLSKGYAFPLLQWLPRTVFPYSAPDCPIILEVRVLNPQSAPASVAPSMGISSCHISREKELTFTCNEYL